MKLQTIWLEEPAENSSFLVFSFLPSVHFIRWPKPQCCLIVNHLGSSVFGSSFGKSGLRGSNAPYHPRHKGAL